MTVLVNGMWQSKPKCGEQGKECNDRLTTKWRPYADKKFNQKLQPLHYMIIHFPLNDYVMAIQMVHFTKT